jgi:hypothetical protein
MGTSTTSKQFAAKIDRFAKELRDQKGALNQTGMAGKRIFQQSAASAGVLGSTIAGKRKAIGARYDITRGGRGVIVSYTGPAHLVNNPTKAHRIEPRRPRGSRSRRRGRQALTIGGNVRASANHPGTSGKRFYQRARAACVKTLPGVAGRAALTEPLRKVFGR